MVPQTIGETNPPKFPIIFMVPERVATDLPPTSMHAVHAPGNWMSLQKETKAIAATARKGLLIQVEITNKHAAPAAPTAPMPRRTVAIPHRRLRIGESQPANSDPSAPTKSGVPAKNALLFISNPRALSR